MYTPASRASSTRASPPSRPIFHHPPDPHHTAAGTITTVPVVDLHDDDKQGLVAQIRAAAETVGFFQVVNHGVPGDLLAETLASVRRFNEQPAEALLHPYNSFHSPAANWRDTLFLEAPEEEVPPPCSAAVPEYARRVRGLGKRLLGLLSEALGLHAGYLPDYCCLGDDVGHGGPVVGCHYYPPCPEQSLTLGTTRHSDPCFLTVLLQDGVGGLQVLLDGGAEGGGRCWADVPPVAGALVVNVGDLLQLVSNDRFKNVEHRVVAPAAGGGGARVSVACFFRTTGDAASARVYGPIAGVNPPPRYRPVTVKEFMGYYRDKGLDGTSALARCRLPIPSSRLLTMI
nr:unnamed protein product [Digitaria exilis]